MGLIDLIENIKEKPEMTRRRILVGTTFTITALIFFFWLSVKLYNVSGPTPADLGVKEEGPIAQTASVIGDFIQSTGERFNTLKNMLIGLSTSIASSSDSIKIE